MKKNNGFSLMEMVVAIGMSALVLAGLGSIFAGTIKVWARAQNSGMALKEARIAMEWLTRDIRQSSAIQSASSGSSASLILKIGTGTDTVTYNLSKNTLSRVLNNNKPDLVAENITDLTFTDQNGKNLAALSDLTLVDFVSISMTVTAGNQVFVLNNGAKLRNYPESSSVPPVIIGPKVP